jgi:uncharacterized repeat protein (TIGR03803 family)
VLYGVALGGMGKGAVFSLTPPASPGGAWIRKTLHSFAGGADGAEPSGPLVIDHNGVLYGTTYRGGGSNYGAVFSLTPPSSPEGEWTETVIYGFTNGPDSGYPSGGVLIAPGPAGQPVLYGTAGAARDGVVYMLTPPTESGGYWTHTVLYAFPRDYEFSAGPLVRGGDGTLYGSTFDGGAQRSGTVYALTPPASAGSLWTFRDVYRFASGFAQPAGNLPYLGEILAIGRGGLILGTTYGGGPYNSGTAFAVRP